MSIEFNKITPSQLCKSAIVPQSLDNQWVPKQLLETMIESGKSLEDVKAEREKYVLKEWRRALIYGEQVVVNRAFMFNNNVVVDDYDDVQNREHFKTFLNTGVIVPYLYAEEAPDEKPIFDVNPILWETWKHVVEETKMSCIRLDWGKQDDEFSRLSRIYHEYAQTLNVKADGLAKNFGIADSDVPAFNETMDDITLFAMQTFRRETDPKKKYITRNAIYEKYVCEEGTKVSAGRYSKSKPFAAAIKQIADLKYNVNLPDALGRYALTPEDSPPRAALGDLEVVGRTQEITHGQVQEVLYSLRKLAFDHMARGLFIGSLAQCTLQDVLITRDTKPWKEYRDAMHNLLDHPLDFANQSAELYAKFEALNQEITRIKVAAQTAKWEPWVKFFITVGTKTVELLINPGDPTEKYWSSLGTEVVATGITPFLMRLVISAQTHTDADLEYSLDFMRGTVQNGRDAMNEIIGNLKSVKGFELLEKEPTLKHDATVSQPEG